MSGFPTVVNKPTDPIAIRQHVITIIASTSKELTRCVRMFHGASSSTHFVFVLIELLFETKLSCCNVTTQRVHNDSVEKTDRKESKYKEEIETAQ